MHAQKLAYPSAAASLNTHDLARLRTLLPLRHLSDAEFSAIATHVEVETYIVGRELFRVGRDEAWIFYLLDGTVEIADSHGETFTVTAGSIEALHPLSPHARARLVARATTTTRVVRLPASCPPAHTARPSAGIEVAELSEADAEFDHRLLFDIYHALREERLVLPTLPDVAVRIHAVANDIFVVPGPRMAEAAAEFLKLIHPEAASK